MVMHEMDRIGPVPKAVGLGFRRAGSSWLHRLLNAQPGIAKPENGLNFFSQEYHRGLQWYVKQIGDYPAGMIPLEMSVSYGYPQYVEQVAARIHESLGEVALFAIVRNPVDRAYSDYLRSLRLGEIEDQPFQQAIRAHPEFLERGRYFRLLEPFLDRFGAAAIHIMVYEDLVSRTGKEMERLCNHIGAEFNPSAVPRGDRKLQWGRPRSRTLYGLIYGAKGVMDRVAAQFGKESGWDEAKLYLMKPYQRVMAMLSRTEAMSADTRVELAQLYQEDVRQLKAVFGIDLPWQEFYNKK